MRFLLSALLVLSASALRADDAAKAVVEKAVKAAGYKPGEAATPQTWKDKGEFAGGGFKMEYTGEWAFQAPDKYRFAINADLGGMKMDITVVANGTKAWAKMGAMAEDLSGEKLEYTLNEVYQMHVLSLVPLLAEKEFKFAAAGEKDVGGKKAVGVKVSREKRPDVVLYFDKETGLLAKSEVKVKDEFQGWKEVLDETYFEDYADVNGKKVYRKLRTVRDGKPMINTVLTDQKWPAKLDPKLFEK